MGDPLGVLERLSAPPLQAEVPQPPRLRVAGHRRSTVGCFLALGAHGEASGRVARCCLNRCRASRATLLVNDDAEGL
eukprot:4656898-Alexandrium_andersonii.AAC.1